MALHFPESWETHNYGRPSHASQRPLWEPPVLDFRQYEERGHMYDSLHRHPQSALGPERWYEHTDLHIEKEVLHDYMAWACDRWTEAWENKNSEQEEFYKGLFEAVCAEYHPVDRAYDENLDGIHEEVGDEEPEPELSFFYRTVRVWDRERKQWVVTVDKYRRTFDLENNTYSLWSLETGEHLHTESMDTPDQHRARVELLARFEMRARELIASDPQWARSVDFSNLPSAEAFEKPPLAASTGDNDTTSAETKESEEGVRSEQLGCVDPSLEVNAEELEASGLESKDLNCADDKVTDWGPNFCFT